MLKKIGRVLILIIAVVVIILSAGGIIGAWGINSAVSNFTVSVISVIQGGVKIVDTAVSRVEGLVQTARSEVQEASASVTKIAGNLQENRPVLTALSDRLESRLGPTVDRIQEAAAPIHDALVTVSNAVSLANSISFIQERAPRLAEFERTLSQITALAADVRQLRTTLSAAVTEKADRLTEGVATALTDLAARIDGRLAEAQSNVQGVQADITALQGRLQTLQTVLLLLFNLIALLATLLYIWVIYSQIVVIRHHWKRFAPAVSAAALPEQTPPAISEQAGLAASEQAEPVSDEPTTPAPAAEIAAPPAEPPAAAESAGEPK